jgi:hypothetical protein
MRDMKGENRDVGKNLSSCRISGGWVYGATEYTIPTFVVPPYRAIP